MANAKKCDKCGKKMTESMSKEEMIDILKGLVFGTFDRTTAKEREALDIAIKALWHTRWTPVSEGLPKVPDCYAVTRKIGSDLITSVCFFDRPNTWYNDNRRNLERNCLTDIVAWMPLPEPYKAESEG